MQNSSDHLLESRKFKLIFEEITPMAMKIGSVKVNKLHEFELDEIVLFS